MEGDERFQLAASCIYIFIHQIAWAGTEQNDPLFSKSSCYMSSPTTHFGEEFFLSCLMLTMNKKSCKSQFL